MNMDEWINEIDIPKEDINLIIKNDEIINVENRN
jgi:hypothetical protein